jgi:hypothetical protein
MLIPIEDLYGVVYFLVDTWYLCKGKHLLGRTVGDKPTFSDSEMLTLMLGIDFFEFTSERRYIEFVRANYLNLFPKLLDQSQFNRRARSLRLLLNELRKDWATQLGVQMEKHFLLDATPVIAVGYRRDKRHSAFLGSADYGFCASRKMKYFGYKLVMLTTLDGLPSGFELVAANTDDRDAADEILDGLPPGSNVWSDKGFIGQDWQAQWASKGRHIWTVKRKNQHVQNPPEFDRLLNHVRQRIECAFDILKEGGRSVEHTLAHTISGLCSRIIAKISSVTLRLVLRRFFGIDVLTYTANA